MTATLRGNAFSQITNEWNEPLAVTPYATGVSLHSHTSLSEETLSFIQVMGVRLPGVARVQKFYEARCKEKYGIELDWVRANWRPPLQPRMAYEVESKQISRLGMYPLVSITDHDTIEGPQLLRTVPSSRHIPISVEWSAPFGLTVFHLGIHNLPSSDGPEWMRRFAAFTAAPDDLMLLMMLRELHEHPQVLIVLNHPIWDLHEVGADIHLSEVRRFLAEARSCIHAVELNGLRHAKENRAVVRLARETGHLLISGGDRHGLEPNAAINLTSARNFTDFVEEIRVDRRSHIHFMKQYRSKWEQRILQSTLVAINDYPQFMPGWQRWDDRVYHPDRNGEMQQLSQLWEIGKPPAWVSMTLGAVRMLGMRGVSASLSLAFPGVNEMDVEMELG
jgi:hypothetical protein